MSPTSKQRLLDIQRRLEERGVTDVKFFWGNNSEKPLSQVASDVADVLEAYLNGEAKPLLPLGDSIRPDETPRTYFHECQQCSGVETRKHRIADGASTMEALSTNDASLARSAGVPQESEGRSAPAPGGNVDYQTVIVGALDGLLSLIARIEAKGEVSHWVEILPALRDAVAILRRMGSRFEPTAEKSNESVELWMPRAQTAAYGLVYLPRYAANFKHEVVQKVVDAARHEGFCGTAAKRLEELGWEIVKLVAKPVSENDR